MKVSLLGVGDMGIDIARHVKNGGFDLIGFDISQQRIDGAKEIGVPATGDVREAVADADVHLVMVATDEQSETVTGQVLEHGKKGSVVVILATNHPNTMRRLSAECKAAGFDFVDAPVCFGRKGARDGTLASLCGGDAAVVKRITPVLDTYSRKVHHVGPVGAGQLGKACNNMLHWSSCIANYEVLSLAKRYGVDAQRMRETLLECPGQNGTLASWDDTRFTWHEKDMDLVLDLAQDGELPLPFYGHVDQLIKFFHKDQVSDLLYGKEWQYLGKPLKPMTAEEGGFIE